MKDHIHLVLGIESYRNIDNDGSTDDYMVDAVKLMDFYVPNGSADPDKQEATREQISALCKNAIAEFHKSKDLQVLKPKAWAAISKGQFWFHAIAKDELDALPKDFHTQGFSEHELLGVTPEPKLDMLFSSTGEPIPGHPDKFMLGIGAV